MLYNMTRLISVFTDGSFIKRASNIYCGFGVLYPNKEYNNISRPFTKEPLTNQRAELYAIYKAIKKINKSEENANILIYTDSEYSIKSLTIWIKNWKVNNWISSTGKEVMNKDIIKKIDNLIISHKGEIKFQHVRSHTSKQDYESINNDIVDKLAKDGAFKI
jgi:ribonuclease HI